VLECTSARLHNNLGAREWNGMECKNNPKRQKSELTAMKTRELKFIFTLFRLVTGHCQEFFCAEGRRFGYILWFETLRTISVDCCRVFRTKDYFF
jgi:hypothetical protein